MTFSKFRDVSIYLYHLQGVLQKHERILQYLREFDVLILMYLITYLCFYIWHTEVQFLPEDDKSKHVGVMKKYKFNIRSFVGFIVRIVY
jgi:hypothetical protein